jgi:hypothetical protein
MNLPDSLKRNRANRGFTDYDESIDYSKYIKYLYKLEVEVFSYCNRKCWFCPNSFVDRMSTNNYMPERTYLDLLEELRDHSFRGIISYSRYNEPFADDIIFTRMEQAKKIIPKVHLHANTNGDYLNKDKLLLAEKSGLKSLKIMLYGTSDDPSKQYTREEVLKVLEKTNRRCELKLKTVEDKTHKMTWVSQVGKMEVNVVAIDFKISGTDRGGTLDSLKREVRTRPCGMPMVDTFIDWNGNVMPCCNVRSDIKEHEWYIQGNINERSLVDCLFNKQACDFRQEMLTYAPKKGACSTCKTGRLN